MTLRLTRIARRLAIVAIAACTFLAGAPGSLSQSATPVASPIANPVAGSVPCTALFGIAAGNACLILLHGSPSVGPLDLYVDGSLLVAGSSFSVLGEFVPVAAGERQLQIVPSGAPLANALVDVRAPLRDGIAYEVAALGTAEALTAQILPIDTRPLPAGTIRLRAVNGSPDRDAVDLAVAGGVPLLAELARGALSSAREIPSGVYQLEVRRAGTSDVVLPLSGIVFAPQTTYTLYFSGSVNEGSFGATLLPVYVNPDVVALATPVA